MQKRGFSPERIVGRSELRGKNWNHKKQSIVGYGKTNVKVVNYINIYADKDASMLNVALKNAGRGFISHRVGIDE